MSFKLERVVRDFRLYWDYDVTRFWDNVTSLFDPVFKKKARSDLSHSYVNIIVEGIRVLAYPLGHVIAVGVPAYGVFCLLREVTHVVA